MDLPAHFSTDANGSAYLKFATSATVVRDWAIIGSNTSQIIQPLAAFYTTATTSTIAGNADIGAPEPGGQAGAQGDNAIPSIRFDNAAVSRTLTLNNGGTGSTFSIGGILVTSAVGNSKTPITRAPPHSRGRAWEPATS